MNQYKSVSFWLSNLIISFGISLVMSIASPLLQGLPIIAIDVVKYTFCTGIISLMVTLLLPLQSISVWLSKLFTKKDVKFLQDIINSILFTAIMSTATLIIMGRIQLVHWFSVGRVFPELVVIAYIASLVLNSIATSVISHILHEKD